MRVITATRLVARSSDVCAAVEKAIADVVADLHASAHAVSFPVVEYTGESKVSSVRHGQPRLLSAPAVVELYGVALVHATAEVVPGPSSTVVEVETLFE